MKLFIQNTLSSAVGFIVAIILLTLSIIVFMVFSSLTSSINKNKIEANSVLKLTLNYPISDKPNTDPFTNFKPNGNFEANKSIHLYRLISLIHEASKTQNIAGIFLDLSNFQNPGPAVTKEIRDALNRFKNENKFIYAYSTTYGKTGYYLASIADSICMYPNGGMEISGLSSTTPFFTETLSEIGIKPEVIRHGKFKAAVEPFLLTEMSDENREQTETLLNDVWSSMLKEISKSRKIPMKQLNEIANDLTISIIPNKSLEEGLIDSLIYPDHFKEMIAKKMQLSSSKDLNFISLDDINLEKNHSKNSIGVIYAEGNIDGKKDNINSEYTKIFKKAFENEKIKAVVLRVNSPGGSALISDEILSQIKISKQDKPLIVSMGNVAASGGYYISCAADKIFAQENTITGSIGVFGLIWTAEELLKNKLKLHFSNVKTNDFSDIGSPFRSLNKKERDIIQLSVKNTYNDFINHVAEGRNMSTSNVDAIGQGRVWAGIRAQNIGLVDSIGGLFEAIQMAAQLAEIKDFQVQELPKATSGIEAIIESITESKILYKRSIEEMYLDHLKNKFLLMNGVQARLPIEYHIE
ncbi:MAG: signal peptide peptidase SppA [Flavobacteriales bacterium]|nr:signal peptide peptidase SppA [Flavobacteriales bacterium]